MKGLLTENQIHCQLESLAGFFNHVISYYMYLYLDEFKFHEAQRVKTFY